MKKNEYKAKSTLHILRVIIWICSIVFAVSSFLVVAYGLYNPITMIEFKVGNDIWSPDSQAIQFGIELPFYSAFVFDIANGHTQSISQRFDWENQNPPFPTLNRQQVIKDFHLEDRTGKIRAFYWSPDSSKAVVITGDEIPFLSLRTYRETLYLVDTATGIIEAPIDPIYLTRTKPNLFGFTTGFYEILSVVSILALLILSIIRIYLSKTYRFIITMTVSHCFIYVFAVITYIFLLSF